MVRYRTVLFFGQNLVHHTCAAPCDPVLCVKLHATGVDALGQRHMLSNRQPLKEVWQWRGRRRWFQFEGCDWNAATGGEPDLVRLIAIRNIGLLQQADAISGEPLLLVERFLQKFGVQLRVASDVQPGRHVFDKIAHSYFCEQFLPTHNSCGCKKRVHASRRHAHRYM